MLRRIHVASIYPGQIPLDAIQARHARDVLRLVPGTIVEVFDNAGRVAPGELVVSGRDVSVTVESDAIREPSSQRFNWTIAAALPKGERADWMVEKLSELGTTEFIPLAAARSVVLPEGKNKRDRWARIAAEAAKQSRREGVMRIGELTSVGQLLANLADWHRGAGVSPGWSASSERGRDARATTEQISAEIAPKTAGWYFSTANDARPIRQAIESLGDARHLTALIGPEGGWTDDEIAQFAGARLFPVRLTSTVLRVETAAVAAAAVIGSLIA